MGLFYYNHNRYYDPELGRYITSDPIGLEGGFNTYVYVGNKPLIFVDFYGLDATDWWNGRGGRNPWSEPTNGNWGGGCWSGGQYSCGNDGPGSAPPTDSADECYKYHDTCYVVCEGENCNIEDCKSDCDSELVMCLRNLRDDPRDWPNPPRRGTEGDTQRYRRAAEGIFD